MHRGAAFIVASGVLVGCLGAASDVTPQAQAEAPLPSSMLSGAAAWIFSVTGPDNHLAVHLPRGDAPSAGALIVRDALDPDGSWVWLMVSPMHADVLRSPLTSHVRAVADPEGGSMSITLDAPEWWGRPLEAIALHAGPRGSLEFKRSFQGADIVLPTRTETAQARLVPPAEWTGTRHALGAGPLGVAVAKDLSVSWETTMGTVVAYTSADPSAVARYEEIELHSPQVGSWYSHRVWERSTGFWTRVGPRPDNASFNPAGFVLLSEDPAVWRLDIKNRAATDNVYDALLIADFQPSFIQGSTVY